MAARRRLALVAGVVLVGALLSFAAACGGGDEEGAAPGKDVKAAGNLDFVVWSYSIETIQDNIKRFEQANPGITIKLADHSWFDYHDIMATKFTGGNAPDVAYSSDHWLQEWVAAGWLEPINERCPELAQYKGEWAPYAAQGMTLDGKLYGVPYYADLVIFIYNDKMVKQAGFSGPPQTLAELKQQALAMKQKGIAEYPINIPMKKDDPWAIEFLYSMVYGEGGSLFDGENNPVFNKRGSQAEKVLQWLSDARNKSRISDPASLEMAEPDVVKAMGAGRHAFTVLAKYNLAELNAGQHKQKGNFRMALMPGKEHSTVGFVRFYSLAKGAVDQGDAAVKAACKFMNYFGGKTGGEYRVMKRWALEKGLGFANLPLYEDPAVGNAINKWGNVELERKQAELARVKEGLTPWWGTWDIYAREQMHGAILGRATPRQALQRMADRWEQLREQHGG
jgi:multiple sugar transport system substrate-binding protein